MDTIQLNKSPYVRLIFSDHLIHGEEKDNGKIKYSTAFLVPKNKEALASIPGITDTAVASIIKLAENYKKAVETAANKEKAKSAKVDNLFKCGDEKADQLIEDFKDDPANKGKEVPGYLNNTRNFWICNAGTNFQPKFFGPKGGDSMDHDWAEENIYAGAWVRMETRGYAWTFNGKKGWSLGLAGKVQKWQDADKFGGGDSGPAEETLEVAAPKAAEDDFID